MALLLIGARHVNLEAVQWFEWQWSQGARYVAGLPVASVRLHLAEGGSFFDVNDPDQAHAICLWCCDRELPRSRGSANH